MNTRMKDTLTGGLPPGWEMSKATDKPPRCVMFKLIDDFKYAEVRYEPRSIGIINDYYALYIVNVDGEYQEDHQGSYEDLGKAISAGNKL